MRVLIIGAGYIGLPLGEELVQLGHTVFGLRRSSKADAQLQEAGIQPVRGDITRAESLENLPKDFHWVVNCAGSSGSSVDDYRRTYFDGTKNVLDWLSNRPPFKYVYTSSTSVYGQDDGSWITERDAAFPRTDNAAVLAKTERLLLDRAGFHVTILRVAGIYGPERSYWLKQFLHGEARMEGSGERFLNMVHQEDVTGAIVCALQGKSAGQIYNVIDTEPVQQKVMFEWLCQRLCRPMPLSSDEGGGTRRRAASNRRISSARLQTELGYRFRYPTFREGFSTELRRMGVT